MQDFKMEQDNYGQFDMVIDESNKRFDFVDGLETALFFQAFTDKRATGQDVANPSNRQGWIGNLLSLNEGYEVGSLVWLKNQSRDTPGDKKEIEAYVKDAYSHMISTGIIKELQTETIGDTLQVTIQRSDDEIKTYSKLWRLTYADNS